MKKTIHKATFSNGVTVTRHSDKPYTVAYGYVHNTKREFFNGVAFSVSPKPAPKTGLPRIWNGMPEKSRAILEDALQDLRENYHFEIVNTCQL